MTRRPQRLESSIQNSIRHALEKRGCIVCKFNGVNRRAWPDLLVLTPDGESIFMEVKRPGEDATDLQKMIHARLRHNKVKVFIVVSKEEAIGLI